MKPMNSVVTIVIAFFSLLVGNSAIAQDTYSEPSGEISRATFTRGVIDHEPIDQLNDSIDNSVSPVYFFTELNNMSGQTVTHRWLYNDATMAEVKIAVNGNRWRAYSTKNMMPMWIGQWTVAVIDEQGNEITRESFDYNGSVANVQLINSKQY